MSIETSYTNARENFADLLDSAVNDSEVIFIHRRGQADAAIISRSELESLMETAYLLSSPKNALRLLTALNRVERNEGIELSLEELRREIGLREG